MAKLVEMSAEKREAEVCTLDLSRAAASCNLSIICEALSTLKEKLSRGFHVRILWPGDRFNQACRSLGIHLAAEVVASCESTHGRVVIVSRSASCQDLLSMRPSPFVQLEICVNSEEAAMRWERQHALPGRRIAAGLRLMNAGWNVHWVIGPVWLFDGWKHEYADLISRLQSAGILQFEIQIAGDVEPGLNSKCLQPEFTERGVKMIASREQRQSVYSFFSAATRRAA